MSTTGKSIALKDLLDLAISSIDPGNVNFNALRKILDILLREANLHNRKIDFQFPESAHTTTSVIPLCDQSTLLDRVSKIENTVQNLLSPPTNQELLDSTGGKGGAVRRPVADLYQSIKLAGKVETLENAVAKVASLVDDILQQDSGLQQTTHTLSTDVKDLQKRLSLFGNPDTLNTKLTTWEGLYHAIEGVPHNSRKTLDEGKRKITATEEVQTDAVPVTKKKRKSMQAEKLKSDVPPPGAEDDDAQQSLWPILREMREANKELEKRFREMAVLIDTKADRKDVQDCVGRLDQVNLDIAAYSTRTEQLFQDSRQLRADLDNLARSFDDYNSTRRHTIRRSTVAPMPSFHCVPEQKRSQGCTIYDTASPNDCLCPPGSPTEPTSETGLSSSFLKLQNIRFENIEGELDKFRQRLDDIQSFIDEQILNLSEKQASLERDIEEVIRLFKERRRPTLKVATLDMNVVEKMLDDYEQIIEEMKTYGEFGKQLGQKTDRLFHLCDDLKRNKADSRTVKDAMDLKADAEDLRDKVNHVLMDEFVRSQALQIETMTKQVQCGESLMKHELGNVLDTLSTRASQDAVEDLRTSVQELAKTVKLSLSVTTARKQAAATTCNVQCLSCGDEVMMEPRNETPYNHPCLPARDVISPYAAYGRNRDLPETVRCAVPRRRPISISPCARSPRTYTSMIDARHEEMRRYKESLRKNLPADPTYLESSATGRYCSIKSPSGRPTAPTLSQSHIAQKIAELTRPFVAKKKPPVLLAKKPRGKR